ncbi:hypothetical protein BJV74DRAFT_538700 [Russula compacta]|nr:hypothetical protein BJV74DRAFT_538700 [Russula compacta]
MVLACALSQLDHVLPYQISYLPKLCPLFRPRLREDKRRTRVLCAIFFTPTASFWSVSYVTNRVNYFSIDHVVSSSLRCTAAPTQLHLAIPIVIPIHIRTGSINSDCGWCLVLAKGPTLALILAPGRSTKLTICCGLPSTQRNVDVAWEISLEFVDCQEIATLGVAGSLDCTENALSVMDVH